MPISFNTIRTGKKYVLNNYGEEFRFEVLEITDEDIKVKDTLTLEAYLLSDLVKYGKGRDYDLQETNKD